MVLTRLREAMGWAVPREIRMVLLGLLPTREKKKLSRKFNLLGQVLENCNSLAVPPCLPCQRVGGKMCEWATAEAVCMKLVCTDHKLEDDLRAWALMLVDLRGIPALDGAGSPD